MTNRVIFNTQTKTYNFQKFNTLFKQYITITSNTNINQLLVSAARIGETIPYNFTITNI